jgi:hypothetical protein
MAKQSNSKNVSQAIPALLVLGLVAYGVVHVFTTPKSKEEHHEAEWKQSADYDLAMFNQEILKANFDRVHACHILRDANHEYQMANDDKDAHMVLELQTRTCD